MLSSDQFDLLYGLWKKSEGFRVDGMEIRDRECETSDVKDNVNTVWEDLVAEGLAGTDGLITQKGIEALKPYKVKNAVIMAAGKSSRFAPLSYEKPKALLDVRGELLIERQIKQLKEAGITDITVIVGFMKEKLFYLEDKYNVDIAVNEDYYRYNNTSSLILVTEKLDNTYICSSDNYFTQNPFEPYVYRSYYSAVYSEGKTDEYCMECGGDGRITKVTVGGKASWYMLGHVYFDRNFSRDFVKILKESYGQQITKEQLWEDLYIRFIDELDLYIRKYDDTVIREFDSLEELRSFDGRYVNDTGSAVFKNICSVLNVEERDIGDICPIASGLTNSSFRFSCKGKKYVYRYPGEGTQKYINRSSEASSMKVANALGLDSTFIYMDPEYGWKLSYYIEDAKTLDYHDKKQVATAMEMLKKLHTCGVDTGHSFDIWNEIAGFEQRLPENVNTVYRDIEELHKTMERLHMYSDGDRVEKCLCHCDSYDPNFLVARDGSISLIDWEYSGMSDPAGDLGTFIACSDYTVEEAVEVIEVYLGRKASDRELRHYMAYIAAEAYYWFVWAVYQDSIGNDVEGYLKMWHGYAGLYGKRALEAYSLK